MMRKAWPSPRRGSIQLPLLFALALFFGLGFRFGDFFREDVVARKSVYGVEAAATAALYLLQPMEYTPPVLEAVLPPAALLDIIRRTLLVNGQFPELFEPLTPGDVAAGPSSVSIRVRPLDPDMHEYTGLVYGIPAMRVGPGRVWTNEVGLAIAATGALPLGVQRASVVSGTPVPFEVVVGDVSQPASFLQWGVSAPGVLPHLVALGFFPGAPPGGTPPPGLAVGEGVNRLTPLQSMVDEVRARLVGRVVLLPLLEGDLVAGFARARILSLSATPPYLLTLGLAPSAAARTALGPAEPRNVPVPAPSGLPAFGDVLRPWWSS